MKTPLRSRITPVAAPPRRRRGGFSLVEVTLALGIVAFGLVAVVGVLPAALASGRQSFDQNRAAAIASTLFTSFRSQPFQSVGYLDEQFADDGRTPNAGSQVPRIDLNSAAQTQGNNPLIPANTVQLYATFLDALTDANSGDSFGNQRRLSFTSAKPPVGISYLVTLTFNNAPAGLAIRPPANNLAHTPPAQANQINLIVAPGNQVNPLLSPSSLPLDQYRFVSTIANRPN